MKEEKNKWWQDILIMIPWGFMFGFLVATIIFSADFQTCQQTLNDPKHCADICADQLLRFENKGLITIHCQKCSTKGGDND